MIKPKSEDMGRMVAQIDPKTTAAKRLGRLVGWHGNGLVFVRFDGAADNERCWNNIIWWDNPQAG